MTNREKLTKTNIYDLLCEMNKRMLTSYECILDVLPNGSIPKGCEYNCAECITNWLNEEA